MKYFIFILFFFTSSIYSQSEFALPISDKLKENANAVVRINQIDITIASQRSMTLKNKRIITILNENGLENINANEYYDKNRKVKSIEATIFNSSGVKIKSFKKKDFKDRSLGDGFSIFNDNRMLYLDYTPINYPFTVVYESEIETSNTAFIPSWSPLEGYYVSAEKEMLNVVYPKNLGFNKKGINFSDRYGIQKVDQEGSLSYSAINIPAMKGEESSPEFSKIAPLLFMKVDKFNLEGVDGEAKTWSDFGKWYYDNLLSDTEEIPIDTQTKIKQLIGKEENPVEIAKIVYQYVQEKTRYVSIQVGIGGFKPMLAKDVDRLGYGDCKALSNYTRSLLKAVGVPSYYTIVYAGRNKKDLQEDFPSIQGNHVILAIPNNDQLIWLECTSQIQPFGFQGNFTDDRNVLIVKPNGGQIVKTKSFLEKDNSQILKGKYDISEDGNLIGTMTIVSKGSQYDDSFGVERVSVIQKEQHYKERFENINNLKFQRINFKNDKNEIAFTEDIELSADGYAGNSNQKLMFVLDAFNFNSHTPKKYRARENPFQVNRGFYDSDEVTINLPEGYNIEAMPNNTEIKTKYGEYQTQITKQKENILVYKRTLLIKQGFYENKDYDEYRLFREQIARNDNAKIVLSKKI